MAPHTTTTPPLSFSGPHPSSASAPLDPYAYLLAAFGEACRRLPNQLSAAPFPVLRSPDFLSLLQFVTDLERYRRINPSVSTPSVQNLCDATVLSFASTVCGVHLPADDVTLLQALLGRLRPSEQATRLAYLREQRLDGTSRPSLIADFSAHFTTFDRLRKALAIPDSRPVVKIFLHGISGELGAMLLEEEAMGQIAHLVDAFRRGSQIVDMLRRSDELNMLRAGRLTIGAGGLALVGATAALPVHSGPTAPMSGPRVDPERHQERRDRSRFRATGPFTPMAQPCPPTRPDPTPGGPPPVVISRAVRDDRRRRHLCFRCGASGHTQSNCPLLAATSTPGTPTPWSATTTPASIISPQTPTSMSQAPPALLPSPTTPGPSPGNNPAATPVVNAAPPPAQRRYPGREHTAPNWYSPSASSVSMVEGPRVDGPFPSDVEATCVQSAAAMTVDGPDSRLPGPFLEARDGRAFIRRGEALLLLDGGSSVHATSAEYAERLGLMPQSCSPVALTLADGSAAQLADRFVMLPLKLTPDGPDHQLRILVWARGPQYIIVGSPVLKEYVIDHATRAVYHNPPAITTFVDGFPDANAPLAPADFGPLLDDPTVHVVRLAEGLPSAPTPHLDCDHGVPEPAPTRAPSLAAVGTPPAGGPAGQTTQKPEAPADGDPGRCLCPISKEVLTTDQLEEITALVVEYADIFSAKLSPEPARVTPFHVDLLDPRVKPVRCHPRPLSGPKAQFLDEQIDEMLANRVIEPVTSDWAFPVVIAPKPPTYRFCVDFTMLNGLIRQDAFPLPPIVDLLGGFSGCPYLAHFDLVAGYHQVPCDPACRHLLTFTSRRGTFCFLRMPFGISTAASHFQRIIQQALAGVPDLELYQDDAGLHAKDFRTFVAALRALFQACRQAGLRIKGAKSIIAPRHVPYVGMLVDEKGYKPDPVRLAPLLQMSPPTSRELLRSYLGMVNYLSRFIESYAQHAAPLWNLLNSKGPFEWQPAHQKAFDTIQHELARPDRILHHRDPQTPLFLCTDASQDGVGAILYQVRDGQPEPIQFLSKRFSQAEKRLCTTEQELLAVVYALERSRIFINGAFTILTDHSNLLWARMSTNRRVARWAMTLNEFECTICHCPGKSNVADVLSRLCNVSAPEFGTSQPARDPTAPVPKSPAPTSPAPSRPTGAQHSTAALTFPEDFDPDINDLRPILELAEHDVTPDGAVALKARPDQQTINRIFALAHGHVLAGHMGAPRTVERVRALVTWPRFDQDITDLCRRCPTCQKTKAVPGKAEAISSTAAARPFEAVYADHLGPFPQVAGMTHVLCLIDRFSRWSELVAVPDQSAETTAEAILSRWVGAHGYPESIVSDNGPAFKSDLFRDVCRLIGAKRRLNVAHHPQGHGCVERLNRVVLATLRTLLAAPGNTEPWTDLLPAVQLAINTSVSRVTHFMPYEVLHGFRPRTPLSVAVGLEEEALDPETHALALTDRFKRIAQQVAEAERQAAEMVQRDYRQHLRSRTRPYEVGQYVLLRNFAPLSKLSAPWVGPYLVIEVHPPGELLVRDLTAAAEETQRVHVDNVAPFLLQDDKAPPKVQDALKEGEYQVERVREHYVGTDRRLWFVVDWVGYPSGTDETVCYADCRWSPLVKQYIKEHDIKLTPALRKTFPRDRKTRPEDRRPPAPLGAEAAPGADGGPVREDAPDPEDPEQDHQEDAPDPEATEDERPPAVPDIPGPKKTVRRRRRRGHH